MAIATQQLTFVEFQEHTFPRTKAQLLPVELLGSGISVVELQRRIVTAVTTMRALSAQIKHRVFLALNPSAHLALTQALLAIRLDSARALGVEICQRQFPLALAADFHGTVTPCGNRTHI